jgi:hypothetical protein
MAASNAVPRGLGLGFGVYGLWFMVYGLGFRICQRHARCLWKRSRPYSAFAASIFAHAQKNVQALAPAQPHAHLGLGFRV